MEGREGADLRRERLRLGWRSREIGGEGWACSEEDYCDSPQPSRCGVGKTWEREEDGMMVGEMSRSVEYRARHAREGLEHRQKRHRVNIQESNSGSNI